MSHALTITFDNIASKGLRVNHCQVTRKVEAGYKPSNTTEPLIGYIVCCVQLIVILASVNLQFPDLSLDL